MSAWSFLFALGVVLPAVALAWAYPWRVRRAVRVDAPSLASRLKGREPADRLRIAADAAPAAGWLRQLCGELEAAADDQERVAVVNEMLGSLEHELELAQGWPRGGAWLAACGTLLVLVAGYLLGARQDLLWALPVGLGAVGACLLARGVGRRHAARQRQQADDLVRSLVGGLYDQALEMPTRRRRRWRR